MKLHSGPSRQRHLAFVAIVLASLAPAQTGQERPEPAAVRKGVFEVPMPAFSKTLEAYYVMFVPENYDPARNWPLIVDLHGASHPERKGALYTVNEVWKKVGASRGYLVAAPQCRARSWGYTGKYRGQYDCDHGGTGPNSDVQYALSVLEDVSKKYAVDKSRVLLAGFSSGADFIYSSKLAVSGRFAACLPICCGPPSMVRRLPEGLEKIPVYSVTGALDVRRDGPWEGFLKLRRMGGEALFREVPGLAHKFPPQKEYELFIDWFERLGKKLDPERLLALAGEAKARQDFLLASHFLNQVNDGRAEKEKEELSKLCTQAIEDAKAKYEAGEYVAALGRLQQVERQFYGLPASEEAATRRQALAKDPKYLAEVAKNRQAVQDARALARLRTFLGVTLSAQDLVGAEGARIETVHPGTVAEKSGMKSGDIVLSFDDKKISKKADLVTVASRKRPGEKAKVEVSRASAGKILSLELSFPPRPSSRAKSRRTPRQPARPGYSTVETLERFSSEHFKAGKALAPAGPRREVTLKKPSWNVAVILYEFSDCRHKPESTKEAFELQYFSRDHAYKKDPSGGEAYGSVYDFYKEMSYGAFEVKGKVFDWLCLKTTRAEALKMRAGGRPLHDEATRMLLAREGEAVLDPYDGIVFIWAGGPGGRATALWPIAGKVEVGASTKPCNQFAEYFGGEGNAIGVACHEFGHNFGFKDKYKLRNSRAGIGPWCLIGLGTHGWKPSGKKRPFHFCAWCKEMIGWLEPVAIDPRVEQKVALRPIQYGKNECIKLLLRPDGSEYFLLENRARVGFFADNPAPGLLILHVGEISKIKNRAFPEYDVVPEHASGRQLVDVNLRYAPFTTFPIPGKTAFVPDSIPSSKSGAEGAWPVWITDIHVGEKGVVYFTVGSKTSKPARETLFEGQKYRNVSWYGEDTEATARTLSLGVIVLDARDTPFATVAQLGAVERTLRSQFFSEGSNRIRRADGGKDFYGSFFDYVDEQSCGTVKVTGRVLMERAERATLKLDLSAKDMTGEKAVAAFLAQYPKRSDLSPFDCLFIFLPDLPEAARNAEDSRYARIDVRVGEKEVPCLLARGVDAILDKGGQVRAFLEKITKIRHQGAETIWCLLSEGHRGGKELGSKRPFHLCPACKAKAGWQKEVPMQAGPHVLRPVEVFKDCYRLEVSPDEYLLFEARSQLGADVHIPQEGLLVWQVKGKQVALAAGPLRSGQATISTGSGKVAITGIKADVRGDVFFSVAK